MVCFSALCPCNSNTGKNKDLVCLFTCITEPRIKQRKETFII